MDHDFGSLESRFNKLGVNKDDPAKTRLIIGIDFGTTHTVAAVTHRCSSDEPTERRTTSAISGSWSAAASSTVVPTAT